MPLKIATYLGLLVALFAMVYGARLIFRTFIFGNPVPGYPSIKMVILFLGGVQLLTSASLENISAACSTRRKDGRSTFSNGTNRARRSAARRARCSRASPRRGLRSPRSERLPQLVGAPAPARGAVRRAG